MSESSPQLTTVSTGVWKGQACVCFHIAFSRLPFMMASLLVSLKYQEMKKKLHMRFNNYEAVSCSLMSLNTSRCVKNLCFLSAWLAEQGIQKMNFTFTCRESPKEHL